MQRSTGKCPEAALGNRVYGLPGASVLTEAALAKGKIEGRLLQGNPLWVSVSLWRATFYSLNSH